MSGSSFYRNVAVGLVLSSVLVGSCSLSAFATTSTPTPLPSSSVNSIPVPSPTSTISTPKPAPLPSYNGLPSGIVSTVKPSAPALPNQPATPSPLGEFYKFNGEGNNVANPNWGKVKSPYLRFTRPAYADGVSSPAGASRVSARVVSNNVSSQSVSVESKGKLSDMSYVFGQFVAHDIALTTSNTGEKFPVSVPAGDVWFDPSGTGSKTISMSRSDFAPLNGLARQQNNWVTGFLDGSVVYGSDKSRADALRAFKGGLLKTSDGNMLPFNTVGLDNSNDAHVVADSALYLAGDVRANENPALVSLHTVFVREHNRIAKDILAKEPKLNDEQVYQKARRIVVAELQWITYNEYLPSLLGSNAVKPYSGYNASVNPTIGNEFDTAAFRFGHSMLDGDIARLNNDGSSVSGGDLSLRNAFFNTSVFNIGLANNEGGVDPFLKGASSGTAQEIDTKVVDDVRNFLFGSPGQGGFDLAALNIQRGRDHGLADYNTVRAAYGLPKVTSFNQITSDPVLAEALKTTYGNVNNIDLWVGGLAENHAQGSNLGSLFTRIIGDQFTRLRTGDRFYFENSLNATEIAKVKTVTLSKLIARNTSLTSLQANVFLAP